MRRAALVAGAVLLDFAVGDPRSLPHPVSCFAIAARAVEPPARRWVRDELSGGAALVVAIVGAAVIVGRALDRRAPAPGRIFVAASMLATGSLLDHAAHVLDALRSGDLLRARAAVGRMVGRDTAELSESGVARAAIESLAESLCDGVVAPLLALTLFELPGALGYKAVNTLDSLIGHIDPPYTRFGRIAARLDDVANFVPARLGVALIAVASLLSGANGARSVRIAMRDGRLHRSPNAGLGEAAMAGALGVRLGGPLSYAGVPFDAPHMGAEFREPRAGDVREAMLVVFLASCLAAALAVGVAALRE